MNKVIQMPALPLITLVSHFTSLILWFLIGKIKVITALTTLGLLED